MPGPDPQPRATLTRNQAAELARVLRDTSERVDLSRYTQADFDLIEDEQRKLLDARAFLPKWQHRFLVLDRALNELNAEILDPRFRLALRKKYQTDAAASLWISNWQNVYRQWPKTRARILQHGHEPNTEANYNEALDVFGRALVTWSASVEEIRSGKAPPKTTPLRPKKQYVASDGDGEGAVPMSLQFETGMYHGNAVALCPQTGHVAYVPLREVGARMQRLGLVPQGANLLHELDYVDDRPEVGGKLAKKLKKTVKKVVKVAKKVVNSKLGKALTLAASFTAGPAGGALLALRAGKALAKKAKKKPKSKEAKAAPIAVALAKKKITPQQASKRAKKIGVAPAKVKSAAVALRVKASADEGNPKAQELIAASNAIDAAQDSPQPLSMTNDGGGDGGFDAFDEAPEELPEPQAEDYDEGPEAPPIDDLEPEDPLSDDDQGDDQDDDQGDE